MRIHSECSAAAGGVALGRWRHAAHPLARLLPPLPPPTHTFPSPPPERLIDLHSPAEVVKQITSLSIEVRGGQGAGGWVQPAECAGMHVRGWQLGARDPHPAPPLTRRPSTSTPSLCQPGVEVEVTIVDV